MGTERILCEVVTDDCGREQMAVIVLLLRRWLLALRHVLGLLLARGRIEARIRHFLHALRRKCIQGLVSVSTRYYLMGRRGKVLIHLF